jgi:hypothetical protein
VLLECLLRRDQQVPFEGYGGREVWLVVRNCQDLLGGRAEGARVEVDLVAVFLGGVC